MDVGQRFILEMFRAFAESPRAMRGFVDHTVYDHTSILRFLEWRFLGAPPHGSGGGRSRRSLTLRDRYANNIGASLRQAQVDADVGVDLDLGLPEPSPACPDSPPALPGDPFIPSAAFRDLIDSRYPGPSETPWIENVPPPNLPTTAPAPD